MILLIGGFAWLLHGRLGMNTGPRIANGTPVAAGTPLPLATVTLAGLPVAGTPLSWQQVALVPGTTTNDRLSVAFSTASAGAVYACRIGAAAGAHPEVWKSRDHGGQWSKLADLPVTGELSDCLPSADRQNPGTVLLGVMWRPDSNSSYRSTDYVVDDSGAWHALPTSQSFSQLATSGGKTYARVWNETDRDPANRLVVSRDGLRTWQYLDASILAANLQVDEYWINSATGAVLVEAGPRQSVAAPSGGSGSPPPVATRTLWETRDDGQHWTQLLTPNLTEFTVQRTTSSEPWRICGMRYDSNDTSAASTNPNVLACTTDGGRTWTARPGLRLPLCTTTNANCTGQGMVPRAVDAVLADDGSLLAVGPVSQQPNGYAVYRLPSGSAQWESLGPMPAIDVAFSGGQGSSILWGFSGAARPDALTRLGNLSTWVFFGNGATPVPLYIAEYR